MLSSEVSAALMWCGGQDAWRGERWNEQERGGFFVGSLAGRISGKVSPERDPSLETERPEKWVEFLTNGVKWRTCLKSIGSPKTVKELRVRGENSQPRRARLPRPRPTLTLMFYMLLAFLGGGCMFIIICSFLNVHSRSHPLWRTFLRPTVLWKSVLHSFSTSLRMTPRLLRYVSIHSMKSSRVVLRKIHSWKIRWRHWVPRLNRIVQLTAEELIKINYWIHNAWYSTS